MEEATTADILCPKCHSAVFREEVQYSPFDCDDCVPPRRLIATLTLRVCLACAEEFYVKEPAETRARVLQNHRLHHRIRSESRERVEIRDLAVSAVECFHLVLGIRGRLPDRASTLHALPLVKLKALADAARRIAHEGKAAEELIARRIQESNEQSANALARAANG